MAKPLVQIGGTFPDVVTGKIGVTLYPPGVTAPDTTDPSSRYHFGFQTEAPIVGGVAQDLYLLQTQSLSHANAYYHVRIMGQSPKMYREALWRLPTVLSLIDVNSVTVLPSTPSL